MKRQATAPLYVADGITIENAGGVELRLNVTYNPMSGAKVFNVHVPGQGPICRLDVDGPPHRPAGRSHKHALVDERSSERNLREAVTDRPDLSGLAPSAPSEAFAAFLQMAGIEHHGVLVVPEDGAP